jgi:hypothetical protein
VIRGDDEAELAVRQVRQYERRSPTGKPEVVHGYQAQRAWWIPHPDWVKGQQSWITAGEKGWQEAGARNRAGERAEPRSPETAAQEHAEEPGEQERGQAAWRAMSESASRARQGPAGRARRAAEATLAERPEHGYLRPDPARLHRERGTYKKPEDHPFFQRNPMSAQNIVRAYDGSTPSERFQGMRWYEDAHRVAWALGGGDVVKGAAVLSAYSPQTGWPVNLFNAARSLAGGRALGKGEAMATDDMKRNAERVMAGEHPEDVLTAPKTNAFGRLIALGRDHPDDELGQVVVDRHAMSVAAGKRLLKEDVQGKGERRSPIGADPFYSHVADMYREAAYLISQREGEEISPHQLQAVTWLYQQRMNNILDSGGAGAASRKGLITGMRNAWARWEEWAREHGLSTQLGTTAASPAPITESEARGNSRPVPAEEFYQLATQGRDMLQQMREGKSAITGLTGKWDKIKVGAWAEVQKSWGGMTVDAHTGRALPDGADKYALSVKPPGIETISVPEGAGQAQFERAMDEALVKFRPLLEHKNSYLGIFHDDEHNRIDIDPVTVVGSTHEVEAIGSYSHNIGGAYHFKTGDGYFPPHIKGEK